MRVLLIEGDRMIGEALCVALKAKAMSIDWVRNGADAEAALRYGGHAACLLDLGLPRADRLAFLKAARAGGNDTPVVIVTARDGIDTRVDGLDLGADDYSSSATSPWPESGPPRSSCSPPSLAGNSCRRG